MIGFILGMLIYAIVGSIALVWNQSNALNDFWRIIGFVLFVAFGILGGFLFRAIGNGKFMRV
jgi:hypothetical protein